MLTDVGTLRLLAASVIGRRTVGADPARRRAAGYGVVADGVKVSVFSE